VHTHMYVHTTSPKAGLDMVVKEKKSHHCPCQELKLSHSVCGLVSTLTGIQMNWSGSKFIFRSKLLKFQVHSKAKICCTFTFYRTQ